MALKLLKIQINFEVKGDPNDEEDLADRVYDYLEMAMENLDLEFQVDDDSEELEDEQ